MKVINLIIVFFWFSGSLLAQSGASFVNSSGDTLMQVRDDGRVIIGAALANGNAVLDIDAVNNDKGILIPRLSTAQRSAMSGLAATDEGLLVYDETSGSFWFWSGGQWNELASAGGGNNSWGLTGNAGTDTTTNFIGTTDNMPLDFRVNNLRALRIEPTNTTPNLIGGYAGNTITGTVYGATISGGGAAGSINSISAPFATISGGFTNSATGSGSTVGGGYSNSATGGSATVGGGTSNGALDFSATVGGGITNSATGRISTVGGGESNGATASEATVAGGGNNTASGFRSTIGGGKYNIASGENATIGGGGGYFGENLGNQADGFSATVPGGSLNQADGDYSLAAGRRARIDAAHDGTFLFSDQNNFDFNSAAANEFAARATGGVRFVTAIDGSGNPTQTVSIDNAGTITAAAFVGDGSGLTGTSGDNLGNHTATQNLQLNGNYLSGDGGNEGVFVDASGNVGIGTNTPTQRLSVQDGHVTFGGNLGIGTSSPSNKLSVAGDADFGKIGIGTNSPNPFFPLTIKGLGPYGKWLNLENISGTIVWLIDNVNGGFNIAEPGFGGSRLFVKPGGNVGIGTESPSNKLSVTGGADFTGNVGIGTNSPDEPLVIRGPGPNNKWLGLKDGDSGTTIWNINNFNGGLDFKNQGADRLFLAASGRVGIGTTNPTKAKVEIQGGVNSFLSYGYLNVNAQTGTASGTNGYSLYASDRIAAVEFNAFSDARIKNILGISNGQQDLSTLMGIEITNYTLIDTLAKGAQSHKKVIAQQVEAVFPQAVSTITDVVPDIYQRANIEDGWVKLATNLQPGEKVKLISKESNAIYEVQAMREGAFQVDLADNGDVFVYGRQVDDFHTVDYEAIAMLNVSATQAQQRIIEAQQGEIAALKAQIASLQSQNNKLTSQNSAFENRFTQIEQALRKMNNIELTSAESK